MLLGRGLFVDTNVATGGFGYPHSVYMSTLYSSGAVGLLLLLGLLACAVYSAFRIWEDPRAKSALGLLLYGALTLVFDGFWMLDHININWLLIWLPCAFLVSLESKAQKSVLS